MRRAGAIARLLAAGVVAFALAHPIASVRAARAEEAPPDTTLERFLHDLSDSTDAYFGLSAAPRDTTGLDSALAIGLTRPPPRQRHFRWSALPLFEFNRVDGSTYGGSLSIGTARHWGQAYGDAKFASGPNDWLGGGAYRKSWNWGESGWSLRAYGGRVTWSMDRDHAERHLATVRALLTGKDRKQYYRREGFDFAIERETDRTRGALVYRDMLESPLATTATWNLAKQTPSVTTNLAAARGRARELETTLGARLPWLPIVVEASHVSAGPWFGSEFRYGRIRTSAGANFGLGSIASLVPQVAYGRLAPADRVVPQTAFYIGGAHSLRSIPSGERGGTGMAVGRVDVIGASDVLAFAHVPHPAALPLQLGAFAAIGSAWGEDPLGGPKRPGERWPHKADWVQEAGISLLYQPGIPDAQSLIRVNYAFPLGPLRESTHWTITFSHAIDLVHPIGSD